MNPVSNPIARLCLCLSMSMSMSVYVYVYVSSHTGRTESCGSQTSHKVVVPSCGIGSPSPVVIESSVIGQLSTALPLKLLPGMTPVAHRVKPHDIGSQVDLVVISTGGRTVFRKITCHYVCGNVNVKR
jgi:hypothetical protein